MKNGVILIFVNFKFFSFHSNNILIEGITHKKKHTNKMILLIKMEK